MQNEQEDELVARVSRLLSDHKTPAVFQSAMLGLRAYVGNTNSLEELFRRGVAHSHFSLLSTSGQGRAIGLVWPLDQDACVDKVPVWVEDDASVRYQHLAGETQKKYVRPYLTLLHLTKERYIAGFELFRIDTLPHYEV